MFPVAHGRWVALDGLLRTTRSKAEVLLTDRAILVFAPERAAAEAAAIDLADFHEGSRAVPILPVVLTNGQRVVAQRPLPFAGAASPILCTRLQLPGLLAQVATFPPVPGFDPDGWEAAPYRPVPALLDAACRLYAGHDVASLLVTNGGRGDLARTQAAIRAALAAVRLGRKMVIFVTGAPGAGKTLCGLDIAFTPGLNAVFLTGNPALVHVLRAALARDAGGRGLAARAARQRIDAVIQPLHHFRDHHFSRPPPPPENVLVIDEAQRCWTADYAIRKTRNRQPPLVSSEPAIILDIMARHPAGCAILCLLGGGQEIHAGEGGLAAWGTALASRPEWTATAPPDALATPDPRQRLEASPALRLDSGLRLGTPVRSWRAPRSIAWIDAMLGNDPGAARRLARDGLPFQVTRSLPALQAALRRRIPDPRCRAGLVASSGARRLRAEGLGGLLWHQDEDAVASWFLETWPDIRSSDALELAGTEFGVQGLELDHVGLCWDADLVRTPDGGDWLARAFRATAWTTPCAAETLSKRVNAYRVLLTRARRSTIIWVPRGSVHDPTRDPARYDAIADYLAACGLETLDVARALIEDAATKDAAMTRPEPALL